MKCPYCDKKMKEGKLACSRFDISWVSKEGHFWNKEKVYIYMRFLIMKSLRLIFVKNQIK